MLTEKSYEVLSYVRNNGNYVKVSDICDATGRASRSISANINDLVKKGFAVREDQEEEGADKPVKYVRLTDAGVAYDHTATDED